MSVKNSIDSRLEARIEAFVDEISVIVREDAVDAVHTALVAGGSSPKATAKTRTRRKQTAKRTARKRSGKRIRRTAADLEKLGATVLAHVKSNPGHRLEEIGAAIRTATSELKRPVTLLMEAKKLRTTGQRRGTKYFAGKAGAPKARKKKTAKKTKKKTAKKRKAAKPKASKRKTGKAA